MEFSGPIPELLREHDGLGVIGWITGMKDEGI